MAAGDTFIIEFDYLGVQKKIKVRDDGAGVLTPYSALLANDAPVTTAAPLPVTMSALAAGTNNIGDVDVLSVIPGVAATNLGKAVDSAVGATDTGVPALMVRKDTLVAITPAVGDYATPLLNQYGDQWVSLATVIDATMDSIAIGARVGVGCDTDVNLDVDEGTADVVKNAAGTLYGCIAVNRSSAIRYLRYYDAATATAGTTATKVLIPIPGDATIAHGVALFGDMGVKMATGICIGATTGFAANDTGAPSANDVIVTTLFK